MDTLMKRNRMLENRIADPFDTFFSRTVEDVLVYDFFNSLDADIYAEADSYTLEVAVPGVGRKDITVHVDGPVMQVSARQEKKRNLWNTRERNSMYLHRSFTLPKDADVNSIKAKCRNGLLTIRIGKLKPERTWRAIEVRGEERNTRMYGKMKSWWSKLKDKANQLLKRKH